jgi:hypothetical protein
MTEPNEYSIETMADFLALDEDQRERCAVDMLEWAKLYHMATPVMSDIVGGFTMMPSFVWRDDDRIGETSAALFFDKTTGGLIARVEYLKPDGDA